MIGYRVKCSVAAVVWSVIIMVICAFVLIFELSLGESIATSNHLGFVLLAFGICLVIFICEMVFAHRYSLCLKKGTVTEGYVTAVKRSRGDNHNTFFIYHLVVQYNCADGKTHSSDIIVDKALAECYPEGSAITLNVYGKYAAI